MIQTRGFWVYVLSLLALLFLIALGVTADHDPGLRDLPMRIAPRDEWQMLDWGLIGSPSRLPFFWSSKHSRKRTINVARYAGLVVELRGTIFHRNWMTASQFQRVLRDLDYRVSRLVPRWRDLHEKSSDHHELQ